MSQQIGQLLTFALCLQVKELPTYKDVDFRNSMQKVYVSDEEKEKIMEKISRDIEVRKSTAVAVFPDILCAHVSSLCSFWCV